MIAFIVRRLIGAVVMLFVTTMTVFLIFFIVPKVAGMTTDQLASRFAGKSPTPTALAEIKERFGLDDPVAVQYGKFVKGLVAGDKYDTGSQIVDCSAPCLGYSFRTAQPVLGQILDRAPVTFSIAAGAAVLWLIGGITVGVLSALRRGTIFDRLSMGVALAGVSLPIFFTGLLSLAYVVHTWNLLPTPEYIAFTQNPAKWFTGLLLPWIGLAFLYAALYARLTRAGMLETMNEDYIRTARAKGLPERTVIVKHALRGTLTPVLTIFGLDIGLLLGGAILTERTFSMKGLGQLALDGVYQSDLPVVVGVTLTAAVFIVLANLVVDILYGVIDPRVRL